MRQWVLAAALFFAIAPLLSGAEIPKLAEISFKPSVFSQDLTQQTVSETFQDSRGTLWFLTQEGLNKYNGFELENYKYSPNDPTSITTNAVTGIAEDNNGDLWISTFGGGLNKYDPIKNGFSSIYAGSDKLHSHIKRHIYVVF